MTGDEIDEAARRELRTLPKELATRVSRHMVMAGRLLDDDPELAYRHAKAARRLASRVGVVREACGFAAYHAGEWSDALAELRAARRLPGREDAYLPIMADCERGLGRPERALELARSPEAARLDQEEKVELRIVESGARRDLGQYPAAVVTLQIPELKDRRLRPWSARLFYAYADALAEAERPDEAREWFARAAAADRDAETDAAERYAELEGLEIIDTEDDEDFDLHRFSEEIIGTQDEEIIGIRDEEIIGIRDEDEGDDEDGTVGDAETQAPDRFTVPAEAAVDTAVDIEAEEALAGNETGTPAVNSIPELTFSAPDDVRTVTRAEPVPKVSFTPPPAEPEAGPPQQ